MMSFLFFINMFNFQRNLKFVKIDEEERMVFGYASTPDLDSDGEIITLDAIKNALPDYLQYPTLRQMHQPKVAGTVTNTDVKDGLYIGAKVIDDESWKMVKEGGYRGFSIGGNVLHRDGNVIKEIELVEISLVDVPANRKAKIDVWKKDKISKNSDTVYWLTNVMINVKDLIMYFEYLGKSTKQLDKMLEAIKSLIAVEAQEPESKDEVLRVEQATLFKSVINSLVNSHFDDTNAEKIRKAVITQMADKIKKNDDATDTDVVDTPVEDVAENVEETTTDEVVETPADDAETVETETPETETTEETPEEEKSAKTSLEKLADIDLSLEKKEDKSLDKAVETKLIDTLSKVVSVVTELEKRVAGLEEKPAPVKSKSAYVFKADDKVEVQKSDAKEDAVKSRMAELEKLFTALGANEFAKQGYSMEYSKLQNEMTG